MHNPAVLAATVEHAAHDAGLMQKSPMAHMVRTWHSTTPMRGATVCASEQDYDTSECCVLLACA
jgi:hypothetical protein